jgi:hypothetical protein
MRNAYKILVRKPEGKRPLRRPRHSSKDNKLHYNSEMMMKEN